MPKLDLVKDLKHLYNPPVKEPVLVDVPEMTFLMIDGRGDPNTAQEYKDAIEALYAVSYTLKFAIKQGETGIDYGVLPLEGLWWVPGVEQPTAIGLANKDAWAWTAMIMQPDFVTDALFRQALDQVRKKRNLSNLAKLRLERFSEGPAAQIMHLGPYSAEGPTIAKLHTFIAEKGRTPRGKHHEIYLGDPRRTAPEKLRTVVRQPVGGV